MRRNIQLRLDYVKLMQQEKEEEAFEVLKNIWRVEAGEEENVQESKEVPKTIPEETVTVSEPVQEETKPVSREPIAKKKTQKVKGNSFKDFNDLSKIKGIGFKTVEDLKKIYRNDFSKFISSIESDSHIPVRDDVEQILKKTLI